MAGPIDLVEEIRRVRQRLWKEHGDTAKAFASWLKEKDKRQSRRILRRKPRVLSDDEIAEIDQLLD